MLNTWAAIFSTYGLIVVSSVHVPMELSAATAPAASFMLTPTGSTLKVQIMSFSLGLYFESTKSTYRKVKQPHDHSTDVFT
jgi:hypothetical protein